MLVGVGFVGLFACGLLSSCARTHGGATASTPAVAGNPNGSWQLYVVDTTNNAQSSSTNGWQLSIVDATNNTSK